MSVPDHLCDPNAVKDWEFLAGHPDPAGALRAFWSRVRVGGPGGCWEWSAGRHGSSTDTTSLPGVPRHFSPRRFAYAAAVGKIPEGLCVLQGCGNRKCLNPAHLKAGPRTGYRGPTGMPARRTLDVPAVKAIMASRGLRKAEAVGRSHGVSGDTVRRIWRGAAWSEVTGIRRHG